MAFLLNGFNVGTDVSVTLQQIETQVIIPAFLLGHLDEFQPDQEDTTIRVVPITNGGKPLYNTVYLGWRGNMKFTRANGNLTGIFATLEKAYFDSGLLAHWNLLATVMNRDGTTDQYMFTAGTLQRHQLGNFRATKEVDMAFEFNFQRMVLTAGYATLVPSLAA